MAEYPGPWQPNPIIKLMVEKLVQKWAEERRLELQRRELEEMRKSDPNYEIDRRALEQMLAAERGEEGSSLLLTHASSS